MSINSIIPGPKGAWIVGNAPEFNKNTLQFLLDIRQFGDVAKIRFGPFRSYVISHPDLAHEILLDAKKFPKHPVTRQAMFEVIGDGLFTSDGELWKRQRKLMQPVFHTKYIGNYAETMTQYAAELADQWEDGATREISKDMTALTMRVIAKTLFDADVTKEAQEVSHYVAEALDLIEERFKSWVPIPNWLPTQTNRKMRVVAEKLDAIIQRFINDRRAAGNIADKYDFLSLLLTASDEDGVMSDKQVRDEAMTLFGAGHETTTVTLTWAWYLLSQHPEVAAKLHEELDRVLAGRLPTLADLPNLPYTEMILKETMRLYPAGFIVMRAIKEDATVGQFQLPKGAFVVVNIYGIHRDARFFPDPEKFDPERFNPENEKSIPKYAYLPFGGGPRVCIGNAFSMMESRLVLATIAQRYHLDLAPGHQVIPTRVFTLKSKYGMKMVVRERERIAAL